ASGSIAASRALARHDHTAGLPGALGDALHAAGKRTAVVADDRAAGAPDAALALADSHGRVDSDRRIGADIAAATADALEHGGAPSAASSTSRPPPWPPSGSRRRRR